MNFKPPLHKNRESRVALHLPVMGIRDHSQNGTRVGRIQSASSKQRPKSGSRQSSASKDNLKQQFGIPQFTAQSMQIVDGRNGSEIIGYNQHKRVQVASITKIMTCYVSLQLIQDLQLDINSYFYVTRQATEINGTSACLKPNDEITIIDLLHGLMLPSGNDAALVLAENLSCLIKDLPNNLSMQYRVLPFIQIMNKWAQYLELNDTVYSNPHGLTNDQAHSTANDVGKLCSIVLKDPLFMSIVKKQEYIGKIRRNNQLYNQTWINTNKLLQVDGFCGMKTGITVRAGPCLASIYQVDNQSIIVVILNCLSADIRWEETVKLVQWALMQLHDKQ